MEVCPHLRSVIPRSAAAMTVGPQASGGGSVSLQSASLEILNHLLAATLRHQCFKSLLGDACLGNKTT